MERNFSTGCSFKGFKDVGNPKGREGNEDDVVLGVVDEAEKHRRSLANWNSRSSWTRPNDVDSF